MSDETWFIQLPHPGGEHRPKGTNMPWSQIREHCRKFLLARGDLVVNGAKSGGQYAFWGEWEPDSRILHAWKRDGPLPQFLHEPLLRVPHDDAWRQNTDPLVFGERFVYSNCRQKDKKLRSLAPGSLVLFGSGQGRGFVLDTRFSL